MKHFSLIPQFWRVEQIKFEDMKNLAIWRKLQPIYPEAHINSIQGNPTSTQPSLTNPQFQSCRENSPYSLQLGL